MVGEDAPGEVADHVGFGGEVVVDLLGILIRAEEAVVAAFVEDEVPGPGEETGDGLFAAGSLGVGEIARRCGFSDASWFGRRFRSRFGCAPGEWCRTGSA